MRLKWLFPPPLREYKLLVAAKQVDELKIVLAAQEIELKKKNEIADKILVEVRAENAKAEAEKSIGKISSKEICC